MLCKDEPPYLSVIVPAYNEEKTIYYVLSQLANLPFDIEIIVVDDGSRDNTKKEVVKFQQAYPQVNLRLISHQHNCGKGTAVRTGISSCKGKFVIIQDADTEYSPSDYLYILGEFKNRPADAVFGSRFKRGKGRGGNKFLLHQYAANRLLTFLSNLATGLHITDMETCYKAIRGKVARSLKLTSNRFEIEPEFAAVLAHARVREVPISFSPRRKSTGKKIGFKDMLSALWHIFKFAIRMRM